MTRRRPTAPAARGTTIPTLAALLGATGCESAVCGEAPADEVRSHGPRSTAALRRGDLREGLREIAVASGLLPHTGTGVERVHTAGAEAPVGPEPPQLQAPGAVAIAGPYAHGDPGDPPPEVRPPPPRRPTPPRHPAPQHPPDPPRMLGGAPMRVSPTR